MKRPLIGEYMSKTFDVDTVVEGMSDYFASQSDLLIGKPLDIGRLFYKRLHDECSNYPDIEDYEVVWDHNWTIVTGMICHKDGRTAAFPINEDAANARRERITLIDAGINIMLKRLGLK